MSAKVDQDKVLADEIEATFKVLQKLVVKGQDRGVNVFITHDDQNDVFVLNMRDLNFESLEILQNRQL